MKGSGRASRPGTRVEAAEKTADVPAGEKALRPAQCREYMRRRLAHEFRGIVEGFVKGAKSGSCQHVKLATELLEAKRQPSRQDRGRRTVKGWLAEVEGKTKR